MEFKLAANPRARRMTGPVEKEARPVPAGCQAPTKALEPPNSAGVRTDPEGNPPCPQMDAVLESIGRPAQRSCQCPFPDPTGVQTGSKEAS
jgi:hypothetical protein